MRILGIDYGDARVGVALSDPLGWTANELPQLKGGDMEAVCAEIGRIVRENNVEKIVLGYPKNMNGTVGERAEKCQLFAEELGKLIDCPVKLWDERCTTVSAHNFLNVTNTRGKKRKAVVDAVAATIILESYLGYRRNSGISAT